tara:strand:- start:10 stop:243 length:234 start_codon:yes stop_codon:yes gene_type:complete
MDVNIKDDLNSVNEQLTQMVDQLNTINGQREQLIQQVQNLNGVAMYLRGKLPPDEETLASTEENNVERTDEYPVTVE